MDPATQSKLLKLLEEKTVRRIGSVRERKVNIRIISATNQDLEHMVKMGRFRGDLYFRLRIITITIPPLRERGKDVLELARLFLDQIGRRYGKRDLMLSPEAERMLLSYSWPGNVRELHNVLEQTVLLAQDRIVGPQHLGVSPALHRSPQDTPQPAAFGENHFGQQQGPGPETVSLSMPRPGVRLADVERDLVQAALAKTDWNVSKAAKLLGLTRDMLRTRIERYGLHRPAQ